ncbi:sphingosine-1-phosphate phosphatase [Armillaria mellea]|nr:sphingosine-1-phosphate phosphatase [Armillaria mellea]
MLKEELVPPNEQSRGTAEFHPSFDVPSSLHDDRHIAVLFSEGGRALYTSYISISSHPMSDYDSSRESSPCRDDDKFSHRNFYLGLSQGRQPSDAYDTLLPPWRAAIRRKLTQTVHLESKVIASMQEYIRTPWLDAYFVYTSSLGTHTFFMTVLPVLYFFGYEDMGRGLVIVLALGVYFSSFIKDLLCSPRPFSPPVTRLTIGTHHLEYGFPSTHSTNSVSIALFLFGHVYLLASGSELPPVISPFTYTVLVVLLVFYTFSIVFGRLYTAMHSFTDCAVGVILGAGLWWTHTSFPGIPVNVPYTVYDSPLRARTRCRKMDGRLVNQHPQPVDDCPCFEDAIAFGSVVLGLLVGSWGVSFTNLSERRAVVMPGSGWVFDQTLATWIAVERGWQDVCLWWGPSRHLHITLPPLYRLLSKSFRLPNRRFYTPATDYKNVPSEFAHEGGLRPIPSVIDLPGSVEMEMGEGSAFSYSALGTRAVKIRNGNEKVRFANGKGAVEREQEKEDEVKHYDADVLTKVTVYAGIALLASQVLPVMFDVLGWGVRSWPVDA